MGNGAGVVVLKPLSKAIADGDSIQAIIKAAAMNNDGKVKAAYTAPGVMGQMDVVRQAHLQADIEADSMSYIETHGTGTALGDPIEISALTEAFAQPVEKEVFCALGTLKANIGHLDAAAGIAGLIKAVLALQKEVIPPAIHCQQVNEQLKLSQTPFYINQQIQPWPRTEKVRRAGVSAFGVGGTNVHLILEESPMVISTDAQEKNYLLPVSAKSDVALKDYLRDYAVFFAKQPEMDIEALVHTLQNRRVHFDKRQAVVAASAEEAAQQFTALSNTFKKSNTKQKTVFLFSGQGSALNQHTYQLYLDYPAFRQAFDECDSELQNLYGFSCKKLLETGDVEGAAQTQPLSFAIQYALYKLWQSIGVEADVVVGHSIGEYAAACVAGFMSLKDAASLIGKRGQLTEEKALPGTMLAVAATADELNIPAGIEVAAYNSPVQTVISGERQRLEYYKIELEEKGFSVRQVAVNYAFHSALMEPVLEELQSHAAQLNYQSGNKVKFISTLTGKELKGGDINADYWARHCRNTVQFQHVIEGLDSENTLFIELGAGSVLLSQTRHCLADKKISASCPSLGKNPKQFINSVAQAYSAGINIKWSALASVKKQTISLPTYPFQRQRYWIEPDSRMESLADLQELVAADSRFADDEKTLFNNFIKRLQQKEVPSVPLYAMDWQALESKTGDQLTQHTCLLLHKNSKATFIEQGQKTELSVNWRKKSDLAEFLQEKNFTEDINVIYQVDTRNGEQECLRIVELQQALNELSLQYRLILHTDQIHPWENKQLSESASRAFAVWGLARTLALEIPQNWGGIIDCSAEEIVREGFIDELQKNKELLSRHGVLYRPVFKEFTPEKSRSFSIDSEKVYLISGGLGSIGVEVCQWLLRQGAKELYLLGRSELAGEKLEAFEGLQRKSAGLRYIQTDIGDKKAVDTVFEKLLEDGKKLAGFIHMAGVISYQPLKDFSAEEWLKTFRPKIQGALNIQPWLERFKVDFVINFSSISSQWGFKSLAHYAAANAFLDSWTYYQRQCGLNSFAINWGPWQGTGMANGENGRLLELTGLQLMSPGQALRSLENLLCSDHPQASIIDFDPLVLKAFLPDLKIERARPEDVIEDIAVNQQSELQQQWQQADFAAKKALMIDYVKNLLFETIGESAAQLHAESSMAELGLDSLMAVQMISRLREDLQIDCSIRLFLENPVIGEFSEVVASLNSTVDESNYITKVDHRQPQQLSFAQERLWVANTLSDGKGDAYNITAALSLKGELNVTILQKSLDILVERHLSLKTLFIERDGEVLQQIADDFRILLTVEEISKGQVQQVLEAFSKEPFDLKTDVLIRVRLLKVDEEEHILCINQHHIISDGWSIRLLIEELTEVFTALQAGQPVQLSAQDIHYIDYAVWERQRAEDPAYGEEDLAYWRQKLQDVEPLKLPFSGGVRGSEGLAACSDFNLSKEVLTSLEDLGKETDSSLFMLMQAALNILLWRNTGQKDILISAPNANRQHPQTRQVYGFFVNTLALRSTINPEQSFSSYLRDIKENCLEAYNHQDIAFEKVVDHLRHEAGELRNCLTQVRFVMDNYPQLEKLAHLDVEILPLEQQKAKFDMMFTVRTHKGCLEVNLEYDRGLYCAAGMDNLMQQFGQLIESIVRDSTLALKDYQLISVEQRQQLAQWNASDLAFDRSQTIVDRISDWVVKTPQQTAIRFEDESFTYAEFNERADELAQHISQQLTGCEPLVALCLQPGLEMPVAMLATLKAGAVYIPLDPASPPERLAAIIDDAKPQLIISTSAVLDENHLELKDYPLFLLDEKREVLQDVELPKLSSSSAAYVIYTSGSSGNPKGVLVEHLSLVNYSHWLGTYQTK
ncbi:MAG: SDR family NAD(P)-dependent oxidoreductase, partial [Lentisphaeraceae bacterium]|nr:SDR family NAD(P)-dependent oxidoreductase [Lentisphaeraceae bacterium]